VAHWSDEETDDPLYADQRNFYKVELWTKDEQRIERMLFAGSNLDKARRLFAGFIITNRWRGYSPELLVSSSVNAFKGMCSAAMRKLDPVLISLTLAPSERASLRTYRAFSFATKKANLL
jgi:hypothetical protein